MSYFKVTVTGSGIDCFIDPMQSAIGFYTTRTVSAPSRSAAEQAAMQQVLAEWLPGGAYAASNRGSLPRLAIEGCSPIPLLNRLLARDRRGYTFYAAE